MKRLISQARTTAMTTPPTTSARSFTLGIALAITLAASLVVQPTAEAAEAAEAAEEATHAPSVEPQRTAQAVAAETAFFQKFNHDARHREAALGSLMLAYLTDRDDGRTQLLLGLNHLWLAAEGGRTNPRVVEHLFLAERFLAMAETNRPEDRRIPSWLIPVRLFLAEDAERDALRDELMSAYQQDPNFHSFSVALVGFEADPGTEAFDRGLRALRGADSACEEETGDPSCANRPRWPHSVEGFLTFRADYELKAGERDAARDVLKDISTLASYSSWPFRQEVEDRLENLDVYADLYANEDPGDDPPSMFSAGSRIACQACHLAE